jgi:arginine decarboxylase
VDYLLALDVKEIHGYEPELGLRIFTEASLREQLSATRPEPIAVTPKRAPQAQPEKKGTSTSKTIASGDP